MSLPSQKRKKVAMKATTRQPTLDTIQEDEAATLSSTLQDLTAIGSNAFRKTSRSRRRRQAKLWVVQFVPCASSNQCYAKRHKPFQSPSTIMSNEQSVPSGTQVSDHVKEVFQALWRAINQHTKSTLMFHLGQLERAMDRGSLDVVGDELAIMELVLDRAVSPPPLRLKVVPPFIAILHAGPIKIIRDMKALGDDMSRNSDVDMAGSDSSMDCSSTGSVSTQSAASNVAMDEM